MKDTAHPESEGSAAIGDSSTARTLERRTRQSGATPQLDLQLLERVRTYDEIAGALGTDRATARRSVAEAIDATMTDREALAPPVRLRAQIIDYLLGEQTPSERERTRSALDRSAIDRAWANEVRFSLALVMRAALPAIPDPATERGPGRAGHDPAPAARGGPPPLQLAGAHVDAGGRVLDRRIYLRRRATAGLILTITGAGAAVIVLSITQSSPSASDRTGAGTTVRATLQRVRLAPSAAQPRASGLAAVVRHGSSRLLLLQGRGLAPNHGDYYAVWLYNSQADAELLGLVSPAVGPGGTFSSDTTLPADTARFHALLVTHERGPSPRRPGPQILSSPLQVH
jgi:hypothetical protein